MACGPVMDEVSLMRVAEVEGWVDWVWVDGVDREGGGGCRRKEEGRGGAMRWNVLNCNSWRSYIAPFRGVTPRAIQAVWQTLFLVVVPNLFGISFQKAKKR